MTNAAIEFWFEFASPYSYVASERIEREAALAGLAVTWRPFLLGPIFSAQGWKDSPFNLYPAKGRYMWRDMERLCDKLALPFRRPTQFPRSGLLAARISCRESAQPWCPDFVRAVFRANFAEDRNVAASEVISEILVSLGLDAAALIARANLAASKEQLRRLTERAAQLGIFGAPAFFAGNEMFWGQDRLQDALQCCLDSTACM